MVYFEYWVLKTRRSPTGLCNIAPLGLISFAICRFLLKSKIVNHHSAICFNVTDLSLRFEMTVVLNFSLLPFALLLLPCYSTSLTSRITLVLYKVICGLIPTFIRKSPE